MSAADQPPTCLPSGFKAPTSWGARKRYRGGLYPAWRMQCRIIVTLAIREMGADYGRFRLGYFWALAEPTIYICVLTMAHIYLRQFNFAQMHSMTPMLFIVLGVMPFLAFTRTMLSTYRITDGNPLTQMPGVTSLDIIAGHALLKLITYNALFLIYLAIATRYDGAWPPRDFLSVLLSFNAGWALGLGMGMVLIPIHRAFPAIEHFMILVNRANFWTAGLFFIVVQVPSWAWPWLTWNPLLHVTELTRSSWFQVYDTPVGSPAYICIWILALWLVGIAADRIMRKITR